MAFSDAPDREAAWLNTTGDGLPTLADPNTGPFQIVQARQPRSPAKMKKTLYVLRDPTGSAVRRFSSQRSILSTKFELRLNWPLTNGAGSAEKEQLLFEQAIDQVLDRIEGPIGDKSHGGRFLSVAETAGGRIDVQYDAMAGVTDGAFTAVITYTADDPETNN